MTLAAPWIALILLATLAPLLLVLWILKLRRSRVRVPAQWLWTEAIEDLRAQVPFKRLRFSLLLLLQLIALALLILAAARPRVTTDAGRGGRTVLLVDVSASMQTRDAVGGDRRFDAAIQAVRAAIDRLHPGGVFDSGAGRTMIIAVGSTPRIVQPFTSSRQLLLAALEHIEPLDEPGRIEEALELARAWATVPDPDVVEESTSPSPLRVELFSDGGIADLPTATAALHEGLVLHHVGSEETSNTAMALVGGERLREDPTRLRPFVSVKHFGTNPRTVDVRLGLNGSPVAVRRVQLPAAEHRPDGLVPSTVDLMLPTQEAAGEALLQAQIVPGDALDRDDVAWALVPAPGGARARLLGDIDPVLRRALSAIGVQWAGPDAGDLTVAALEAPARLGQLPSLTFGAPPASSMVRAAPDTAGVDRIVTLDPRHPVTRGSTLGGVNVRSSTPLELSPQVRVLAQGTRGPLIVAWREGGAPHVHVAFKVEESDWPVREDFITFLVDAEAWLAGRSDERRRVIAGDTLTAVLPGDVESVEIVRDGQVLADLTPPDPSRTIWGPAPRAGVHEVRYASPGGNGVRRVVVAMPVALEGNVSAVAPDLETGRLDVRRAQGRSMPLWPFAVAAALVVLLLEWWVWSRRQ